MSDHESPLGLLEIFDATRAQSLRIAELESEITRLTSSNAILEHTVQELRLRLDNILRQLANNEALEFRIGELERLNNVI